MIDKTAVELALQQLLECPKLLASPQMTAFVCYVVRQTLDTNQARIKAFTIGVEALGKPDDFDPQTDASVRVLAGRLRKCLDTYNRDLMPGAITINLPKGAYVPEFAIKQENETIAEEGVSLVEQRAVAGEENPLRFRSRHGGPRRSPTVRRSLTPRTR